MNEKIAPVSTDVLSAVAAGTYYDPHAVLGAHLYAGGLTIRTLKKLAQKVVIVTSEGEYEAEHEYDGIWVALIPSSEVVDYRVRVTYGNQERLVDDAYRYLPTVGELDRYLFNEGRHEELWKSLGAHLREYEGPLGTTAGASFAVWAPNAQAVRVIGDFNYWDGTAYAMRSLGSSGIWEIFVPGVELGARYKYEILTSQGRWIQKADPMARATEIPPATASVVTKNHHSWNDEEWMSVRRQSNPHNAPMSIYEVHVGSWNQGLGYRGLASELVSYVKEMGYTHVEFMPVAEHPFGGSWGYQVSSYYAPSSRYGTPDDFKYLVDSLHQAGIGVILDWVPAHFPKDEWALAKFDGTCLYEDPNPLRGEQPDWGTLVFNFGRPEIRNFLVANALYWLEEFHIDGLRVDAVASMLYLDYSREAGKWEPNIYGGRENLEAIAFLQETNATAYRRNPGIVMIAEESTAWPGVTSSTDQGGLGFGMKWNMGWMNDTLRYFNEDPVNRKWHHGELTFSLVYAFSENFVLPLSHDEVVHGKGSIFAKMPGDKWQKLAGMRLLYAYQWAHPGKQLLFMGQDLGAVGEWNQDWSVDWNLLHDSQHEGLRKCVKHLNEIYASEPALWVDSADGFEWIDATNADANLLTFIRRGYKDDELLVCIVNFSGNPHENFRIGLPHGGRWDEILNTDSVEYGGSGVGNMGFVEAEDQPWNGRSHSAIFRIPPLGAIWLKPHRG
ncbi:1,4-alpha-glucan branching protein GlgB [Actinomycetaceae bacterium TAE3-ERU4]|nr:1,4-alpha-glucan branching protein GlgB [Actinomycetaceae bacterium TAE3-ERU4]